MDVDLKNSVYRTLSPEERIAKLFEEYPEEDILVTSSFGTTSSVLLHMINKVHPGHPVHFIDTSFHFNETLQYKEQLTALLGLKVIDVRPPENKHKFTKENKTWQYHQDLCCFINKVEPLSLIKSSYKVWISGLLGYQNVNRQHIRIFEPKDHLLKFHPLIDMTSEETALYQLVHGLPNQPLLEKGYDSVGCTHCTKKGKGRNGRWSGVAKTECGLHM